MEATMPKEVRYLIFSSEELYQALLISLQGRAPKGVLRGLAINNDPNQVVTLTYLNNKGSQELIRFDEQEVLRSLIVYCGRRHIPMSAKANKMLEVKDGAVGLMCTLNFENSNKITASGDKLSYQDEKTDNFKDDAKRVAAAAPAMNKAPNAPKTS
jgi:hypothetical protein